MRVRHIVSALIHRENTREMRAYESFEDALRDSDSYEDPRIIEVVSEKTKRYRETLSNSPSRSIENRQTVQNLFVLSYVEPNRPINVLEVGGACGASYFETKHLLPDRIRRWTIAETAAMAAAGRGLTNDPDLSFHSNIVSAVERLKSRDLAIAQGVLQYTSDPLPLLKVLFELRFSYVYITRTAVADVDRPLFTKQETDLASHGPGRLPNAPDGRSSQPMTLVSREALLSSVPTAYEIVFNFEESEDRILSIGSRSVTVRDIGFLARLQPQS
jgi:putative methyltransferase (TIGR04325 family)